MQIFYDIDLYIKTVNGDITHLPLERGGRLTLTE